MSSLINLDDLSLDRDEFNKVKTAMNGLSNLIVPNGRQYINFKFESEPKFKDFEDQVNDSEDVVPTVTFQLVSEYNLSNISGLFDEWQESQSSVLGNRIAASIFELPSAVRFTMLLSNEVDKALSVMLKTSNVSIASLVELDFNDEDGSYSDFLKLNLSVNIMSR